MAASSSSSGSSSLSESKSTTASSSTEAAAGLSARAADSQEERKEPLPFGEEEKKELTSPPSRPRTHAGTSSSEADAFEQAITRLREEMENIGFQKQEKAIFANIQSVLLRHNPAQEGNRKKLARKLVDVCLITPPEITLQQIKDALSSDSDEGLHPTLKKIKNYLLQILAFNPHSTDREFEDYKRTFLNRVNDKNDDWITFLSQLIFNGKAPYSSTSSLQQKFDFDSEDSPLGQQYFNNVKNDLIEKFGLKADDPIRKQLENDFKEITEAARELNNAILLFHTLTLAEPSHSHYKNKISGLTQDLKAKIATAKENLAFSLRQKAHYDAASEELNKDKYSTIDSEQKTKISKLYALIRARQTDKETVVISIATANQFLEAEANKDFNNKIQASPQLIEKINQMIAKVACETFQFAKQTGLKSTQRKALISKSVTLLLQNLKSLVNINDVLDAEKEKDALDKVRTIIKSKEFSEDLSSDMPPIGDNIKLAIEAVNAFQEVDDYSNAIDETFSPLTTDGLSAGIDGSLHKFKRERQRSHGIHIQWGGSGPEENDLNNRLNAERKSVEGPKKFEPIKKYQTAHNGTIQTDDKSRVAFNIKETRVWESLADNRKHNMNTAAHALELFETNGKSTLYLHELTLEGAYAVIHAARRMGFTKPIDTTEFLRGGNFAPGGKFYKEENKALYQELRGHLERHNQIVKHRKSRLVHHAITSFNPTMSAIASSAPAAGASAGTTATLMSGLPPTIAAPPAASFGHASPAAASAGDFSAAAGGEASSHSAAAASSATPSLGEIPASIGSSVAAAASAFPSTASATGGPAGPAAAPMDEAPSLLAPSAAAAASASPYPTSAAAAPSAAMGGGSFSSFSSSAAAASPLAGEFPGVVPAPAEPASPPGGGGAAASGGPASPPGGGPAASGGPASPPGGSPAASGGPASPPPDHTPRPR